MRNIEDIITQRGDDYGEFTDNARTCQRMKRVMHSSENWDDLSDDKREALHMIVHKIARIVNGSSTLVDSWMDIEGYARLVRENLTKEQGA